MRKKYMQFAQESCAPKQGGWFSLAEGSTTKFALGRYRGKREKQLKLTPSAIWLLHWVIRPALRKSRSGKVRLDARSISKRRGAPSLRALRTAITRLREVSAELGFEFWDTGYYDEEKGCYRWRIYLRRLPVTNPEPESADLSLASVRGAKAPGKTFHCDQSPDQISPLASSKKPRKADIRSLSWYLARDWAEKSTLAGFELPAGVLAAWILPELEQWRDRSEIETALATGLARARRLAEYYGREDYSGGLVLHYAKQDLPTLARNNRQSVEGQLYRQRIEPWLLAVEELLAVNSSPIPDITQYCMFRQLGSKGKSHLRSQYPELVSQME